MSENKTKSKIINLLKENGITNLRGGIQLFADQYDKDWYVSINYNGTGLHIPKSQISTSELDGDENIKVYKAWTYKEK